MRRYDLVGAITLLACGALGGCVAHAQAGGYAEAEAPVVFTEPPTLVEVDADVWVVRDYDYAVYYVGGSYWVYKNDVWWRSSDFDRGWARVEVNVVPTVIARRDHHAYVHFHGGPGAKTRAARERLAADQHGGPPGHDEVPGVGNQRKAEEGNPGLGRAEEKKEERREEHAEKKEERREEHAEKKQEKKERKEEQKGGPKKK